MPRGEFAGREGAFFRKSFRDGFLRRIKAAGASRFIERRSPLIGKLFVLDRIRLRRVRFQEPVHQSPFLFLRGRGGNADEQCPDGNEHPHVLERAEAGASL